MAAQSCDRETDQSLFPLTLTPVEVCWLLEDVPSHPLQFYLRLHIAGRLQKGALERALGEALARHPLLSAVVRQRNRSQWDWVPGPDKPLQIRWLGGNPGELPPAGRINVLKERGLRVTVTEAEDGSISVLTLQFQHTACDGLSAADFAGDLLTAYAGQLSGEETGFKYKKLEPATLLRRGDPGWSRREKWRWGLNALRSLVQFREFYKRRPLLLVDRPLPSREQDPERHPVGLFHQFSRAETAAIAGLARKEGASLNVWLVAHLFIAFAKWRSQHCQTAESDLFRVTIPVSLRGPSHRATPAANVVSVICLDRSVGETRDRARLLAWVEAKFNQIGEQRQGLVLPTAVSLLQRWPRLLAAGLARKRFSGTTLLSNLGPVLTNCHLPRDRQGKISVAGLKLETVEFLAVLRPGHAATLAASSYAGELTLGMHYDPCLLHQEEAGELFRSFLDALRNGNLWR